MSKPVPWYGSNRILGAPKDYTSEQVQSLPVFSNGSCCVSCWELSKETIDEIVKTGVIFISVHSGNSQPPIFVGSEKEVREVVVDYGPVWAIKP